MNLAKTVGVLSVAILVGVALDGGTYAYLNAKAALPSATIVAGEAALSTTGSPLTLPGLYPGSTQSAPFTIDNTGDVPLTLDVSGLVAPTADSGSLSTQLTIRLDVTTAAGCSSLPETPAWQSTFAASPPTVGAPASLASTVDAGASATLCLSVSLPLTAPTSVQSQTTNSFTVTVGGVQT